MRSGAAAVLSSPSLRQRLDTHACAWFDLAAQMNQALLGSRVACKPIDFGVQRQLSVRGAAGVLAAPALSAIQSFSDCIWHLGQRAA